MARRAYLRLAAVVCLALTGCGGPKPQYKYQVAVIPKGMTHDFWQSIQRGATAARDDLVKQGIPIEVIWEGPRTEGDKQAQIEIINRHAAGRVSGIVLAPQDREAMVPPVRAAVAAGVPVVIIDSALDAPDAIVKYVATDNRQGGRLAAEHLLGVLEKEGKRAPKLVLFRYHPNSESTEQREAGFEEYVENVIAEQRKKGEQTITWVSKDRYAGTTTDAALKEAQPLLQAVRDQGIDGIFAVNESSATGMLRALQSLGMNKKVRLVGFDSSPPLRDALAEGDIDGLILQDPYRMGYLGVWTLVQHLEGRDVAPGGDKVLSTGEYLTTRDNLEARRELFEPEVQVKRTIDLPPYLKKP